MGSLWIILFGPYDFFGSDSTNLENAFHFYVMCVWAEMWKT